MSAIIGLIEFCLFLMTVLALALIVALSLPQSKFRDIIVHLCGWTLAVFCALYVVLPDPFPIPFLPIDDFAAFLVGLSSAVKAWEAGNRRAVAA